MTNLVKKTRLIFPFHFVQDGGPEDFRCPVCAKKFKQKAHKYRHIESLHNPVQIAPENVVLLLESDR